MKLSSRTWRACAAAAAVVALSAGFVPSAAADPGTDQGRSAAFEANDEGSLSKKERKAKKKAEREAELAAQHAAKLALVHEAMVNRDMAAVKVADALDAASLAAEEAEQASAAASVASRDAAAAQLVAAAAQFEAARLLESLRGFARELATSGSSNDQLLLSLVVSGESPDQVLRLAESSDRVSAQVTESLTLFVSTVETAEEAVAEAEEATVEATEAADVAEVKAKQAARVAKAARKRLNKSQSKLSQLLDADTLALVNGTGVLKLEASGDLGCAPYDESVAVTNGMLPSLVMCGLPSAPGHRLRTDAAAAFEKMSAAYRRSFGTRLCITDSYRPYEAQVSLKKRKPTLAAIPGTSNHGWGIAIDACDGINSFGTPQHNWMRVNASMFGFFHPSWAQATGSKPEPWHWEFSASLAKQMSKLNKAVKREGHSHGRWKKKAATSGKRS